MSDPPASGPRVLRALIVDDSAYNRRHIAEALAATAGIEVVGKAADGDEALRMAALLRPDLVTLDLEMPRMDGFTFLRLLLARQPASVIVVSSYAQRTNMFRALELGAIDFVVKPELGVEAGESSLGEQVQKKALELLASRARVKPRSLPSGTFALDLKGSEGASPPKPLQHLVVLAGSTGAPAALLELFSRAPSASAAAYVVAQHMPDKFTRTFAERLARKGPLRVREASDGDRIDAGHGYVCAGGRITEVVRSGASSSLRVSAPSQGDRHAPSADRLFASAAAAFGPRCVAVVLSGMGDDGVAGAHAVRKAGGVVVAESAATAVVRSMPEAAVRAGVVTHELPLPQIADFLARLR